MNYIRQLNAVMVRIAEDDRLNATHVSLYLALFQLWNLNRFKNPISINRAEVMKISKIGSRGTYHKCVKDLHHWSYLKYMPSHNPLKGSKVYLFNFETSTGQVEEQPVGQVVGPSLNSINNTKHKKQGRPSSLNEVEKYFREQKFPLPEAEKFFNYYSSNGWKVGGRTPMKDWKAAARNWMLKAKDFTHGNSKNKSGEVQKRDNLRTTTDKNYDQPL